MPVFKRFSNVLRTAPLICLPNSFANGQRQSWGPAFRRIQMYSQMQQRLPYIVKNGSAKRTKIGFCLSGKGYNTMAATGHTIQTEDHSVQQSLSKSKPVVYMTRRHFASKKDKKSGGNAKCGALAPKLPKNRKPPAKRPQGLREDCFAAEGGESGCGNKKKSPCTGKCGSIKRRRKPCPNDESAGQAAETGDKEKRNKLGNIEGAPQILTGLMQLTAPSTNLMISRRCMSTSQQQCQPKINKCERKANRNEQIQIPDSYKIQRVYHDIPIERDYDVVIRTGSIAISGSDIHVFENGSKDCEGMTLGHDATGFVDKVGRCVHHLRVGDRVVMESALSCGICQFCKRGVYNMCAQLVYNGFMCTHQVHPADLCHKLPDCIDMEAGALTQTLALGCQSCFKANIIPTTNMLIIGSGPSSVAAALCARAIGSKNVILASTMRSTLENIKHDFGFDFVHFDSNALFGEVLEGIYAKFKDWPDAVINCAISAMTMNLAVMALKPCGICVLAECESECASFNALDILMKNIRLIPSFRSTNMFPTALQLMRSGRAPMHKFIAAKYPWKSIEDAFKCAQHEANMGTRKVVVNCTTEN